MMTLKAWRKYYDSLPAQERNPETIEPLQALGHDVMPGCTCEHRSVLHGREGCRGVRIGDPTALVCGCNAYADADGSSVRA